MSAAHRVQVGEGELAVWTEACVGVLDDDLLEAVATWTRTGEGFPRSPAKVIEIADAVRLRRARLEAASRRALPAPAAPPEVGLAGVRAARDALRRATSDNDTTEGD